MTDGPQSTKPEDIPARYRKIGNIRIILCFAARYPRQILFAGLALLVAAGATLATALDVAEKAPKGSVILAMLPDTGERYLSTPLFEGVNEGSDDEWLQANAAAA